MKKEVDFPAIIGAFLLGALLMFVVTRKSPRSAPEQKSVNTDAVQAVSPTKTLTAKIGDDPILGDKNKAKVAIVEFSDFECPYCQKFHKETFNQITEKYVDTGKAILVFKDFPLSFHEPAARNDANAAECVKEIGGDQKFFQMVKLIYSNTGLNGKGLPKEDMLNLVSSIGIDKNKISECIDSNKFSKEIDTDIAEGQSIGVEGTPSFLIGSLDKSGEVKGELIVGAQPFSEFEKTLDKLIVN